jgi:hypothetical protein
LLLVAQTIGADQELVKHGLIAFLSSVIGTIF